MTETRTAHVHLELFYNSYFLSQAERYRAKTGTTGRASHIQAKYPTKLNAIWLRFWHICLALTSPSMAKGEKGEMRVVHEWNSRLSTVLSSCISLNLNRSKTVRSYSFPET